MFRRRKHPDETEAIRFAKQSYEKMDKNLRWGELHHGEKTPEDTFFTIQFLIENPIRSFNWWVLLKYKWFVFRRFQSLGNNPPFESILEGLTTSLAPGIRRMGSKLPRKMATVALPQGRFSGSSQVFSDGSSLVMVNQGVFQILFILSKAIAPLFITHEKPRHVGFILSAERALENDAVDLCSLVVQRCAEAFRHGMAPFQDPPFEIGFNRDYGLLLTPAEQFVVGHEIAHILMGHHDNQLSELSGEQRRSMEFECDLAAIQMISLSRREPLADWGWVGALFALRVLDICHLINHPRQPAWMPTPRERLHALQTWIGNISGRKHILSMDKAVGDILVALLDRDLSHINDNYKELLRPWELPDEFFNWLEGKGPG